DDRAWRRGHLLRTSGSGGAARIQPRLRPGVSRLRKTVARGDAFISCARQDRAARLASNLDYDPESAAFGKQSRVATREIPAHFRSVRRAVWGRGPPMPADIDYTNALFSCGRPKCDYGVPSNQS